MSPEHKRLAYALLLSLLIHSFLLSLIFGGQGLWRPGIGFPWLDRRIEAPDLRVVVVTPEVAASEPAETPVAEPAPQASVEQPVASAPPPTPSVTRAPAPRQTVATIAPKANPRTEANLRTSAATGAAPAQTPLQGDRPGDTAPPPIPKPPVIALTKTDEPTWVVPAPPAMPMPVIPPAPRLSIPDIAMPSLRDAGDASRARIDQEAAERSVEPAKPEPSKQEEERQAEQLEAARRDAARQEAALVENARQEAALQEAARQEAARQEAARQEAARQEAARQEAARQEAARQEAARQEAARAEAARQDATRQEAARAEAAREARLRAIGRQLDEEAARRDAATTAAGPSSTLPLSLSTARRYRLWGRSDPNAELILYAEAWARKIQMNKTLDSVRELAKQPHADPLVTVAIRSDGSVEAVTIVQSSGVPALDEAIRRVVESQKPYQAFPPALARDFDVIEIRRTWYFDVAIRLY
jgi:TonB family protein